MKQKQNENVVRILEVDKTIHEPARMVILSFLYGSFLFIFLDRTHTPMTLSGLLPVTQWRRLALWAGATDVSA